MVKKGERAVVLQANELHGAVRIFEKERTTQCVASLQGLKDGDAPQNKAFHWAARRAVNANLIAKRGGRRAQFSLTALGALLLFCVRVSAGSGRPRFEHAARLYASCVPQMARERWRDCYAEDFWGCSVFDFEDVRVDECLRSMEHGRWLTRAGPRGARPALGPLPMKLVREFLGAPVVVVLELPAGADPAFVYGFKTRDAAGAPSQVVVVVS